MNGKALVAMAAAVVMVAGCGTLGRLTEYGMDMSDALFRHDGRAFTVSVHPREDVFLIRPGSMENMGRGFARGLTLGMAGRPPGYEVSRSAAVDFIAPSTCEITRFTDLDASTGFWEAHYRCPEGVDLRQLVVEQRGALRDGAALRPPGS